MHRTLLVTLASTLAFSSAAQTGRIAHFSHGGSVVALAMGRNSDNFGISYVEQEWKDDTIATVSPGIVEHRGQMRMRLVATKEGAGPWKRAVASYQIEDMQKLQAYFPKAVVTDVEEKKPARKKPASRSQAFPKRPFQYSYWRELAGAAALGAVGLLLGKKRVA